MLFKIPYNKVCKYDNIACLLRLIRTGKNLIETQYVSVSWSRVISQTNYSMKVKLGRLKSLFIFEVFTLLTHFKTGYAKEMMMLLGLNTEIIIRKRNAVRFVNFI